MGLDQIKDLTRRTIEKIIQNRPFFSLEDFLARVDPRRQEAESLAKVGAFSGMGAVPAILRRLDNGGWRAGQMNLFSWQEPDAEDWTVAQKSSAQQELLGVSLEAHPLELAAAEILAAGAISIVEAVGRIGKPVVLVGLRQSSHRARTAKGESMLFLSLEDLTGALDVVVFPDVYHVAKPALNTAGPYVICGVMELDSSSAEPYLRAEKITSLDHM